MKKAIVLLLALVVLGGAVFAQAKVTGRVQGVATLNDAGLTFADQVRLNFSASTEDKNVGIAARLQTSTTLVAAHIAGAAGTAVNYSYAYGYAKLFEGKFVVTAGKLYHFDYYLGGNMASENMGNTGNNVMWALGNKGMLLQVLPVEGLNIGLRILPAGTLSTGDFGLAASYEIKDTATIVLTSDLNDTVADSALTLGANITAVKGLTAIVGYKGISEHGVFVIAGYAISDAMYAEVGADLFLTPDFGYFAEASFDYSFDPFTASVYGTYDGTDYYVGAELNYSKNKFNYNFGFAYDGAWSLPVRLRYNF